MFKGDSRSGDLNGFLDGGSHIRGELHFEDTFRIDGKVTGKVISSAGELVVGDRGVVEGDVEAARVFVSGSVQGSIMATERIELAPGAKVEADLGSPKLVIAEGAFFEGRCTMEARPSSSNVTPLPVRDKQDRRR